MDPAAGTAPPTASRQKHWSLCRLLRAHSNRTVGTNNWLGHYRASLKWSYFGEGSRFSFRWALFLPGVCPARTRKKCTPEWRVGSVCESGSDSGSSSGSVRASRGSWGSCSSTSSMEGDKDASARTHRSTTSSRKSMGRLPSLEKKPNSNCFVAVLLFLGL